MPTITVRADRNKLPQVLDFIHVELDQVNCPPKTVLQIDLAVEEMYVNVASYAYGGKEGDVRIGCETNNDPGAVTITIIDKGTAFNPLDQPEADTTLTAEQRTPGGLGILLTKKIMDVVRYERRDDENILILCKSF